MYAAYTQGMVGQSVEPHQWAQSTNPIVWNEQCVHFYKSV